MKNDKIIAAYNAIKLDDDTKNRILAKIIQQVMRSNKNPSYHG